MTDRHGYNYGLALLRCFMCFCVVCCHYQSSASSLMEIIISAIKGYAVPVFMFMSFLLVHKTLIVHDKQKILLRLERLSIPLVGWGIIYWTIYLVLYRTGHYGSSVTLKSLILQVLMGHSAELNSAMWYQVVLIWLTVLFYFVVSYFDPNYQRALIVLALCAIFIQYSGANMIFDSLPFEFKYPLGRFSEMLPIAVVASLVAQYNLLDKLKKYRIVSILAATVVGFATFVLATYVAAPGYGYSGIDKIIIAMSLVAIFYLLPLEKIPTVVKSFIGKITRYTMGIYAMHIMIGRFVTAHVSINSTIACLLIYVICYGLSYLGEKITVGTRLRYLFQ